MFFCWGKAKSAADTLDFASRCAKVLLMINGFSIQAIMFTAPPQRLVITTSSVGRIRKKMATKIIKNNPSLGLIDVKSESNFIYRLQVVYSERRASNCGSPFITRGH